jgi:hypothetical protein
MCRFRRDYGLPSRLRLPEGPEWTYEIELDDYWLEAVRSAGRTTLYSRRKLIIDWKRLSTCLLAESVHPVSRAEPYNSKWHVEDWGSVLWMHVHSHASVDLLPSRPGARLRADPNAQRRPHHTSQEVEAWPPCESLRSYSASCCPDCPKPSWSRRSNFDPPRGLHSENRQQF